MNIPNRGRNTQPPSAQSRTTQGDGHGAGIAGEGPLSQAQHVRMLHDLQAHRLELQTQNEELLRARAEGESALERSIALFDLAPIPYFLIEPDARICRANLAGGALFSCEPARLVGAVITGFFEEGSQRAFAQLLSSLIAGEGTPNAELLLQGGSQGPRVVAVSSSLWSGAAKALLTMLDVTDRYRMAEEARGANERYRRIVETTSEGVVITDAYAHFTFVNERFAQMLGYPREAIIGRTAFEFMERDDHPRGVMRLEARRHGATETYETKMCHRDGHHVWIRVTSNPLLDAAGAYEGSLAVISDFTERRRAEETRLRLAAIVESSGDAIVGTDLDGMIVAWNRAAEQLYGYTADEVLGTSVDALLPAELAASEVNARSTVMGGASIVAHETSRKRKDGSMVDVSLTMSPIRDAEGGIIGISKVTQDITARRQTERALRNTQLQLLQSQKMEAIGSLAGGIAHDFNNLLSVMIGYAGLMLVDTPPHAMFHPELTQILKAGQRAGHLTRQLLAFSRKQVQQVQSVDLNRCVSGLESILARLLGAKVRVSVVLASNLKRCRADPTQIEQVIINLAVNARDAMPDGGLLTIETANVNLDADYTAEHPDVVAGRYVMLTVRDTGTGIDSAIAPRIFEPFFTTKKADKGTGLGLSTVYGIVKQTGGHIGLETAVGQGTALRVYLPPADDLHSEDDVYSLSPPAKAGTETLLLVDDDQAVRATTAAMLRKQGYRVHEAMSAGDALILGERLGSTIKLVVTDVVMPHLDGPELVKRLAPMLPSLRVLYISGYTDDVRIEDALRERAYAAYLPKPFLPHELGDAVRALLDPA